MKKILLIVFVSLALAFLVSLPVSGVVAFPAQSEYTDLLISHYPNLVFLRRSLLEFGQFPLWSGQILSGYPFYANPLSGLWYLPNWLALILPFPFAFHFLFALHLLWGGWGVFVFLKRQGCCTTAAVLAGVLFAFFPKIFGHYAAGHVTLVNAVYWTPWLLVALDALADTAKSGRSRLVLVSPGIVLGIIALADIRWAAFAAVLYFAYVLMRFFNAEEERPTFSLANRWVRYGLMHIGLCAGLSAPIWLPLLTYSNLSTRSLMTMEDRLTLSIEPLRLLGLVMPDFGGYAEWLLYPGALLVCIIPFMIALRRNRWIAFWSYVSLFAVLFALGKNFILAPIFYRLPGADLLRVPSRMIFLMGLATAILVGLVTQQVFLYRLKLLPAVKLYFVILCAFCLALAAGVSVIGGRLNVEMVFGAVSVLGFSALLMGFLAGKLCQNWFGVLMVTLAVVNSGVTGFSQIQWVKTAEAIGDSKGLLRCMNETATRIYSPSYSVPQQIAAENGLELADGVDPLQLIEYAKFMEAASGVPSQGYSVTIPPFATGDVQTDNQAYTPDLKKLGLLNVGTVVSDFAILALEPYQLDCGGEKFLYQNPYGKPRAWVETNDGEEKGVQEINASPNQIAVAAEGPGRLVLSEIAYPGWKAWVDGAPVEVETAHSLLRSVQLEQGQHQVVFRLVPIDLYIALAINMLTIIIIFILMWKLNHAA